MLDFKEMLSKQMVGPQWVYKFMKLYELFGKYIYAYAIYITYTHSYYTIYFGKDRVPDKITSESYSERDVILRIVKKATVPHRTVSGKFCKLKFLYMNCLQMFISNCASL
jgi:hypothetical protein